MRILIAAAAHASNISGVQRHALNLTRCLLLRPEVSSVHLVAAPWQTAMIASARSLSDPRLVVHIAEMGAGALDRNLWFYRRLPKLAASLKADLVHLAYPVPVNASAVPCPIVLTLHDLYPYEIPENFGFPKVLFNRIILQHCIRNVDAIACVSDVTLRRMRQYVPASMWHKARRIYNCVDPHPRESCSTPLPGWRGEPFILCIAQHRPNKNIPLLIRAFHRLLQTQAIDWSTKLVIVGIRGPETERIEELIEDLGLTQHVPLLQGLTDAELQWCYAQCVAVAAPSVTEGFGLPVAEALLAGCRVVCSDIPAFREISETACEFASDAGEFEENFTAAMASALKKPKPAPLHMPLFSSNQIAAEYIELYRELLTSPGRQRIAAGRHMSVRTSSISSPHNQIKSEAEPLRLKACSCQSSSLPDVSHESANVLGVEVSAINMEKAVELSDRLISSGGHGYVCVTGVHGVMEAHRSPELLRIMNGAFLRTPDGMPMSWVGWLQGKRNMDRVSGPDYMMEMCALSVARGYTHFLYGGDEGVAEELQQNLEAKFPGIQIVGRITPSFQKLTLHEEQELFRQIQETKPDILWIGISTPKQDRFMAQYADRLGVPLMVGVGAAFDYHTGRVRDCSTWIKRAGLQWLHRLLQDPKRLWWRYLRNNPVFLWKVALQLIGLRHYPSSNANASNAATTPASVRGSSSVAASTLPTRS